LTILASDSGAPAITTFTATVAITVGDVEDNPVVFHNEPFIAIVPEDTAVSTAVLSVTATDADGTAPYNTITYVLIGGNTDDQFAIDVSTGVISVNKALDYEAIASYSLTVRAIDSGATSVTTYVTSVSILLSDVNDNAPNFDPSSYEVAISENSGVGVALLTVKATDSDKSPSMNTVSYSIIDGNDGKFVIGQSSGTLALIASADYESASTYHLTVQAIDNGTPAMSSTTVVTVTVSDVEDNAPVFPGDPYIVYVAETAAPGTVVITVAATDADGTPANNVVTYEFIKGAHTNFAVDPVTGVVTTVHDLYVDAADYDDDSEYKGNPQHYSISVGGIDSGNPGVYSTIAQLIITVDVNSAPYFDTGYKFLTLPKNQATVGKSVYIPVAVDENVIAPNNELTFTMTGDTEGWFAINPSTGEITVVGTVKKYVQTTPVNPNLNKYTLVLTVTDGLGLSGEMTLVIQIT